MPSQQTEHVLRFSPKQILRALRQQSRITTRGVCARGDFYVLRQHVGATSRARSWLLAQYAEPDQAQF